MKVHRSGRSCPGFRGNVRWPGGRHLACVLSSSLELISDGAAWIDLATLRRLTELTKTDVRNVDNVVTLADGCLWVCAISNARAQGQNESAHVLVERKETHHLWWLLGGRERRLTLLGCCVCSDSLHVNLRYLEQVDWDAALVATTKPLWVELPSRLVLFYIDGVVQGVQLVFYAPVLGVLQLVVSFLGKKLASSQVAEQSLVVVASGCCCCGRSVVVLGLAEVLEFLQGV
jgi:hypothetical protein